MDDELRASLWNVLHVHLWDSSEFFWYSGGGIGKIRDFARKVWLFYFKQPMTEIPSSPNAILSVFQQRFFSGSWNEVYDFLEAIVAIARNRDLERDVNFMLETEGAGYRLIEGHFVEVTDPKEIEALQEAITDNKHAGVAEHLSRALQLLSDRKNPDFRNSIKESISAVEAMACILAKKKSATLTEALRVLEQSRGLHPALRDGFSKLYGYTSDANGIRHALLDEPNLTAADAKYFLLSCTSFVNYLKTLSAS